MTELVVSIVTARGVFEILGNVLKVLKPLVGLWPASLRTVQVKCAMRGGNDGRLSVKIHD